MIGGASLKLAEGFADRQPRATRSISNSPFHLEWVAMETNTGKTGSEWRALNSSLKPGATGWVAAATCTELARVASIVPATFPAPHRPAACLSTIRFVDRRYTRPRASLRLWSHPLFCLQP